MHIFPQMPLYLEIWVLGLYSDIQLYPSFHNQRALPLYIMVAHWSKKSEPMYILLSNLQFSGIETLSKHSSGLWIGQGKPTISQRFRFVLQILTFWSKRYWGLVCLRHNIPKLLPRIDACMWATIRTLPNYNRSDSVRFMVSVLILAIYTLPIYPFPIK